MKRIIYITTVIILISAMIGCTSASASNYMLFGYPGDRMKDYTDQYTLYPDTYIAQVSITSIYDTLTDEFQSSNAYGWAYIYCNFGDNKPVQVTSSAGNDNKVMVGGAGRSIEYTRYDLYGHPLRLVMKVPENAPYGNYRYSGFWLANSTLGR